MVIQTVAMVGAVLVGVVIALYQGIEVYQAYQPKPLTWDTPRSSNNPYKSRRTRPTRTFRKSEPCTICQESLQLGELDSPLQTLMCGHEFHKKCWDKLQKYNTKCPKCWESFK